ncbi:variable surface protein [Plasmodium gonderi]|uniref:Variable surface protein n=1 Tax=Plasmodium gonderi TaxID=77519 RepID=A0A1Y1JUA6_PLAGO|nr:variable surface protein [Plasmodium gonderi]GAW84332.1 variable surface protein [Plasmodium gonderi]
MTENKKYAFLKEFNTYKQKMDHCVNYSEDQYNNKCDNIVMDTYGNSNYVYKGKCPQIICYLKSILHDDQKSFSAVGCKYLNYWVYHDLLNRKYITGILSLYHSLLTNLYSIFSEEALKDAKKKYIQDIDLPEITAIFNMNSCLDIKKRKGQYDAGDHFCKELEEYIYKYNSLTNYKDSITGASHKISHCKTNTSANIIIPTILILLIPGFLFTFYKVNDDVIITPHNSRFHRGIANIINKWCNIHQIKRNSLQQPDTCNSILWESRYNMLYNTT